MNSLLPLLKAISHNKQNLELNSIDDKLFNFILKSGLASYLNYASVNNDHSKFKPTLNAADLTAKAITHIQIKALDDLLLAATPVIDKLILLKGIAICQNYYPQPHLRIMSDIDILVSNQDSIKLQHILLEMGYIQKSTYPKEFYKTHHHSMPFYNKNNNVWIEVHTHLFSGNNPALSDDLFKIENIFKNCIVMNKEKYSEKTKQLCPEFQLIYTCSHWADEFKVHKGCIQIIDMIQIIKNNGIGLDWNKLFNLLNNSTSASYVYLIFSYFDRYNIIDLPENYAQLFKLKHKNMGYLNVLILQKIISKFILGEQINNRFFNENNLKIIWRTLFRPSASTINLLIIPWNILFPPETEQRYKISFLLTRVRNFLS